MGCMHAKLTPEEKIAIERSKQLDRELTDRNRHEGKVVRVLLLGTGESGKSTILKQMRIIFDNRGFTDIEKNTFKVVVRRNVVESMQTLLEGVEKWKYKFDSQASIDSAEFINAIDCHHIDMWNADIVKHISQLWLQDSAVKKSYQNRNKLQLLDSAEYLFTHVHRMAKEEYLPNQNDILRARLRTTGIVEEDIPVHGVPFQFLDVGGQRNERRKWIHAFAHVKAVIFVAALSEYDQVLYEDDEKNRLSEALDVFEDMVNNEAFQFTSMILFLNKTDLFLIKIKNETFKGVFPEFGGIQTDFKETASYIEQLFLNRCSIEGKDIFTHLTCATDTDNIERVFEVCKLRILEDNLAGVGLR